MLKMSPDIRILSLHGPPKDRGRTHGEAFRSIIAHAIELWKTNLKKSTGMDPDQYIDQFLDDTRLSATARVLTPHLVEEVTGIAEGAGLEFNTIFAWQCLDEEWWYRIFEKKIGVTETLGSHCSLIGCSKERGKPPVVGGNVDIAAEYDGLQVLLRIYDTTSSLQTYAFTFAGMIGIWGLSNRPLGVCANTVLDLNHSAGGLPVAFVIRTILEKSCLSDGRFPPEGQARLRPKLSSRRRGRNCRS